MFTWSQWSIWLNSEYILPNWKVDDSHVFSTTVTHMFEASSSFPRTLNSFGSGFWLLHPLQAFRIYRPPTSCCLLVSGLFFFTHRLHYLQLIPSTQLFFCILLVLSFLYPSNSTQCSPHQTSHPPIWLVWGSRSYIGTAANTIIVSHTF